MRITVGCPRCGRVEIGREEMTLVVSPWESASWYVFDCVGCAVRVVKTAAPSVAAALAAADVTVRTVPAEVVERSSGRALPPITVDEVLDDLLALGAVTNPRSVAAGSPPARPGAA